MSWSGRELSPQVLSGFSLPEFRLSGPGGSAANRPLATATDDYRYAQACLFDEVSASTIGESSVQVPEEESQRLAGLWLAVSNKQSLAFLGLHTLPIGFRRSRMSHDSFRQPFRHILPLAPCQQSSCPQ